MTSTNLNIAFRIKKIIKRYLTTPALIKTSVSFVTGTITGASFWYLSHKLSFDSANILTTYVAPFGAVLVKMLKMIVLPIVFFTLIVGAASLPLKKLGRIGLRLILFYLFTSIVSAVIGFTIAIFINPGTHSSIDWGQLTPAADTTLLQALQADKIKSITGFFLNIFDNPVAGLSNGNYIPIIILALLFGFAINVIIETKENPEHVYFLNKVIKVLEAVNAVTYKIVNWIMKYAPVGVFALSTVNTGIYGPKILGPYFEIVIGVILGILIMIFVVYGILFKILTGKSYFNFLRNVESVLITAFVTRSSAATLPFSLKVANEKLKIKREFYSFGLPIATTLNMDGICVHLPMFIVFAANLYGYNFDIYHTISLMFTTFLITVGAGGIPGGSLLLLIFILNSMGIDNTGEAIVMSVALGLNPLLDMFETMNNVTGDLVCTYIIADRENLIDPDE